MNEIALESYAVMKRVTQGKTILLPYFIMIVLYGLWKDTRYVSGPKKGHFFQERKDRKLKRYLLSLTDCHVSCVTRHSFHLLSLSFFRWNDRRKRDSCLNNDDYCYVGVSVTSGGSPSPSPKLLKKLIDHEKASGLLCVNRIDNVHTWVSNLFKRTSRNVKVARDNLSV